MPTGGPRGPTSSAVGELDGEGERVVVPGPHEPTAELPLDLTGLGLWSVRRQTRELGGRIVWAGDGDAFTLTVQLPDR